MRSKAANGSQIRAGDDTGQRLRPTDGHIQAVFRVQETNVSGQVVFIRGRHRYDDNLRFLPLKLIHSADTSARWQHLFQQLHLQVIGGYYQDVFDADRVLYALVIHITLAQEVCVKLLDLRRFFVRTLAVAIVLHRAKHQPAVRHLRSLAIE
ncbi:hypothetical protein D3C84_824060 [compost metagenome]